MPPSNQPQSATDAVRPGLLHRIWHAPVLLLVVAVLFWASHVVVSRAISGDVPPVALAFWRWTGASVLVLMIAGGQLRRDLPVLLRHWRMMALLAALGVAAFNTMLYVGLQTTTAINILLLQSAMPMVILVSAFLIFRERTGPAQIGAVLISIAGVIVIASRGVFDNLVTLTFNKGDLWMFAAVVVYSVYLTLLRKRPQVHPFSFLGATFILAVLMLIPFYLYEQHTGRVIQASVSTIAAIAYIAVFPGVLAFLFFNRGVELIGSGRAGHFMHLTPVAGILLAFIFLGERMHSYHGLGIALIAAGLLIANFARARKRQA